MGCNDTDAAKTSPLMQTGTYRCYLTRAFPSGYSIFHEMTATSSICLAVLLVTGWIQFGGSLSSRVVVVGSGVGGLAVAARIASSTDSQVTILEKNSYVGGRCGSFDVKTSKGTFRHERGPSLLLLKQVYQDLFQDCSGKCSEEYGLEIKQCIPAYQVVFQDGDTIELGFPTCFGNCKEAEQASRDKMDSYEVNGALKWDEYMQSTAAFLDCGLPNFIEERLDLLSFPAFLREALRDGAKAWPLKPHSDVLDATFDSQKMRALASFQNLYVGLEPFRNDDFFAGGVFRKTAPAVFGLLSAIECHPSNKNAGGTCCTLLFYFLSMKRGAWPYNVPSLVFAPIGGFRAVQTAFQRLAEEHGVHVRVGATVTKINSTGVHIQDETENDLFLPADLVICNADLPYATRTILSKDNSVSSGYDWDDSFDYSSGVIAFHWSFDMVLDELNTHNVFMVASSRSEAKASWRVLRPISSNTANNPDDMEPFNFYVHRASKTDSTAAPSGCDALLVLVPCKTLIRNEEYAHLPRDEAIDLYKQQFDESVVSKAREAVYKRLAVIDSLKDLRKHVIDEVVDTPGTYADYYNVGAGTPFAMSHGFRQLSLTRPGAEFSGISNVLFVGAGSRPGNGVPLVLIGAKKVAEKALRKLQALANR